MSARDVPSRSLDDARVLFVFQTFALGGSERQAITLAEHLVATSGCRVEIQMSRSPVARGTPWTAKAWAPTTRNRVSALRREPRTSRKSWFIGLGFLELR